MSGEETVSLKAPSMPVFKGAFLHPRYWLTWLSLGIFFIFSLFPMSVIDSVGVWIGERAARKNKKRFNIARANLSKCFPEETEETIEEMVVEHFRCYIRGLLHYGQIWWLPTSKLRHYIEVEGFEQIESAHERGKNIIVLTCHSMGLEFLGIALAMHYPCAGPYKPLRNEVINWVVARGRVRLGTLAYTRDDGFRPLIRATRSGRLLIYLADEDLGAESSVFVPFFGVQKSTVSVLGRLAQACNAVVIPCVGCYDPVRRKYIAKMYPVLEGYPTGDDVRDSTLTNQATERAIMTCVTQYMWTLRLFQTRPPGEHDIYP